MQSVLLRRTPPAFELSRHPCPLTRNYREGTPGRNSNAEGNLSQKKIFPCCGSWSVPRNGLEPLRARRLPVSDRGARDGTRFEEAEVGRDRVESSLEGFYIFFEGYFQLDFCSAREGMCIYYGYSISWIYEVFRSWEIFMEIFRCTHFKILER